MTYENYPWLDVEDWLDFVEHRKEIKKPMTERAEKRMLKLLREFTDNGASQYEILDKSIRNGWQDIYPPKEKKSTDNFKGSTIDARPGETYEQYEARKRQVRH